MTSVFRNGLVLLFRNSIRTSRSTRSVSYVAESLGEEYGECSGLIYQKFHK